MFQKRERETSSIDFAQLSQPVADLEGRPKKAKTSGSDNGFLVVLDEQTWIAKLGVSLSLLARAVGKTMPGSNKDYEKAMLYLDSFIMGNFTRVAEIKDEARIATLSEDIVGAFFSFIRKTKPGKELLAKLEKEKREMTSDEVIALFQALSKERPALKDVIGLAAFADIVSGAFSQRMYNVFAQKMGYDFAKHAIFTSNTAIYQASALLPDAKPFDKMLLDCFDFKTLKSQLEGKSEEEAKPIKQAWLGQAELKLKALLNNHNLKGLCAITLFRLVMGESADNGPDNAIWTENGLVAIDLTGFRYQRQNPFRDSLGWGSILCETDQQKLLDSLFHSSVFKTRFLDDLVADKELRGSLDKMIAAAFKDAVRDLVVEEVQDLRDWFAALDEKSVNADLEETARELYIGLPESYKFDRSLLQGYINQCKPFISAPVKEAKAAMTIEHQPVCAS